MIHHALFAEGLSLENLGAQGVLTAITGFIIWWVQQKKESRKDLRAEKKEDNEEERLQDEHKAKLKQEADAATEKRDNAIVEFQKGVIQRQQDQMAEMQKKYEAELSGMRTRMDTTDRRLAELMVAYGQCVVHIRNLEKIAKDLGGGFVPWEPSGSNLFPALVEKDS